MLKTGIVKEIFSSDNDNTALLIELSDGSQVLKFVSDVSDSGGGVIPSSDYAEDEKQEVEIEKDPADIYAEQALSASAPIFESWLGQIESSLFDGAESLEQVRDRIDSVYSELPAEDFASLMSNLLLAGFGAGHYQVQQETADDEEFAEDALEYATKKSAGSGKQKTCNVGYSCGYSCINKNKACADPLSGQAKNYADWLSNQIKAGAKLSPTQTQDAQTQGLLTSIPPAPTSPTATGAKTRKTRAKTAAAPPTPPFVALSSPIKTNTTELDNKRADLVKRFGKNSVEDAEKNVQKILNAPDTSVFVRVSRSDTLEKILGDRFRTSAELGVDTHKIPHLKDGYQKARNRVEAKTLGYDEKKTPPEDRPIYGYLGGNDLGGASHASVADAYGSIALKLKPEIKDRATFTGADSFKSGIASEVMNAGSPPPPNAASLVSTTRHGYDRTKLPSHYPSYYADDSADDGQLRSATKAKNIDDLAPALATTGNAYMEAQIHGKVTAKDIAEIHFTPSDATDRPTAAIAQFAKDNNTDLYVNGKKLSAQDLDAIISPPARKKITELKDALEQGDFDSVSSFADDIHNTSQGLKLRGGDRYLQQLYQDSGFDGLPRVGSDQDVTKAWKDGGALMVRGVDTGIFNRTEYLEQFQTGDYYVGNGIYGNGTYVGHAGKIVKGKFVGYNAKTEKADAMRAFHDVEKHNYITPSKVTFRMALDKSAVIATQSELLKKRDNLIKKIDNWKAKQEAQITAGATTFTLSDVSNFNTVAKKNASKYNGTSPQITTVRTQRMNGGLSSREFQSWNFPSTSGGKDLQLTVEIWKGQGGLPTSFTVRDSNNSVISRSLQSGNKPNKTTIKELYDSAIEQETLRNLKLDKRPQVGELNADTATMQKLKDFNERYDRMKSVLGIDVKDDGGLGRFAVIQGIDAVALDQSYEPDTFMNLLNRSKVIIQKDELKYSKAMKTGAL